MIEGELKKRILTVLNKPETEEKENAEEDWECDGHYWYNEERPFERSLQKVIDDIRKEFPTVKDALARCKTLMPRRNWDQVTDRNRVQVQTILLKMIEEWHVRWLGYTD